MFLNKPKIQNTLLTSATEEEKSVLHQLSMIDIDKKCETIAIKKRKATVLALYHLFEKALDLIPVEKGKNKKNSDSKNHL